MNKFLENQISISGSELETLLKGMFENLPNESGKEVNIIAQYFLYSPALLILLENYPLIENELEYYRIIVTYAKPLFTSLLAESALDQDYPGHFYLSLVFVQLAFNYFENLKGLFPELIIYLPNQLFIDQEMAKLEWLGK